MPPPAPLDVSPARTSSAAARILPDGFDQREVRRRRAAPAAQLTRVAVFAPARHVGDEVDAEEAARAQHARDRRERRCAGRARGAATAGCRTAPSPCRTSPARMAAADVAADEHARGRPAARVARAAAARAPASAADDRCRRAVDARAGERHRHAAGAAPELEHAAAAPAPARARTARRGGRASARSPSRRTGIVVPAVVAFHHSNSKRNTPHRLFKQVTPS